MGIYGLTYSLLSPQRGYECGKYRRHRMMVILIKKHGWGLGIVELTCKEDL